MLVKVLFIFSNLSEQTAIWRQVKAYLHFRKCLLLFRMQIENAMRLFRNFKKKSKKFRLIFNNNNDIPIDSLHDENSKLATLMQTISVAFLSIKLNSKNIVHCFLFHEKSAFFPLQTMYLFDEKNGVMEYKYYSSK